jgi:hypothetical protein
MIGNFFVGDDFTWLKWAADAPQTLINYFLYSDGFFYRPGTKLYFYIMYHTFWLNQVVYHLVSLFLHFAVTSLFFILAKKILKSTLLSASAAFLFLILSGSTEMVFWISSTGHLFNALFGLLGLIFFIKWDESKKSYYFIASFVSFAFSLLFHELGVVLPLLVLAYKLKDGSFDQVKNTLKRADFLILFVPVFLYLILRLVSHSHWLNGDYSYDLLKLPFNFFGNILGYIGLTLLGPMSFPLYEKIRSVSRENILLAIAVIPIFVLAIAFIYKKFESYFNIEEEKVILFGLSFFVISLLPFIGLGNITSRYSYLASLGLIFIFVILIKKLYNFLLPNGKEITIGVISVFVIVYSLFHVIQVQQTYFDWKGAGEKSQRFFVSIDALYSDHWSRAPFEFHFVNVPIKYGEAWVFPVGLEDAVWFAFQNKDAKVFIHQNVESALNQAGTSLTKRVFRFTDDGSVEEVQRNTQTPN